MTDEAQVTQADIDLARLCVPAAIIFAEEPEHIEDARRRAAQHIAKGRLAAEQATRVAEGDTYPTKYHAFIAGMEAAGEICGSLAETTYDDTDSFEAATGCEAAIMRVVREQKDALTPATAAVDPTPAVEEIAQIIYDAMCWGRAHAETGSPPAWTVNGNSFAQEEARSFARAVVKLIT